MDAPALADQRLRGSRNLDVRNLEKYLAVSFHELQESASFQTTKTEECFLKRGPKQYDLWLRKLPIPSGHPLRRSRAPLPEASDGADPQEKPSRAVAPAKATPRQMRCSAVRSSSNVRSIRNAARDPARKSYVGSSASTC